jgi:hypothetical protein
MFRCLHTLACLTVLATALPQGWCCWLIPLKCCANESTSAAPGIDDPLIEDSRQPQSVSGSIFRAPVAASGSCTHCCGMTQLDDSQSEVPSLDEPQPRQPVMPTSTSECCQRAPVVRPISFDFLVNPLLALTSDFDIGTLGQIPAVPSDIVAGPSADSLRRHARLCRWLC